MVNLSVLYAPTFNGSYKETSQGRRRVRSLRVRSLLVRSVLHQKGMKANAIAHNIQNGMLDHA